MLIDFFILWHKLFVNVSLVIKEAISMHLIFDLLMFAFFNLRKVKVYHSMLLHLISGSYSNFQHLSSITTYSKK